MNIKFILIILISLLTLCCSTGFLLPVASITIKVLDEDGKPLEGINIGLGFERNTGAGTRGIPVNGYTDEKGSFTGKENTINFVGYRAYKDGYYESEGEYRFQGESGGRWYPWNPEIKVVLRKIGNPIPMYAREVTIEIPKLGKEIGFDLIESDWVKPFGNGINADFKIKIEKEFVSKKEFNSKLTVNYTSKFDGTIKLKEDFLHGSQFKLPRNAPEIGYQPYMVKYYKMSPGKLTETDYDKNTGYIFRIRSEIRNGKFYRAMYGKINGDISYDAMNSKTAIIYFKYYLNPDYSKNLEFNPKRNLFTGLKDSEQVGL